MNITFEISERIQQGVLKLCCGNNLFKSLNCVIMTQQHITGFATYDLKIRKVGHGDIGQMNLYLNYFKTEENVEGDNEPIGIILSAEKDEVLVEYATGGISNKIFVSKYQLYLPDKKLLQKKVEAIMAAK